MLKRTVIIFAAAAFLGGTAPTQTVRAGDDIWDLMDPSWWYDEMFDDDDDDDWRRYRNPLYNPYWGGPYYWRPPPYVIHIQTDTEPQAPEVEPPD